jgi:hypothetical protein
MCRALAVSPSGYDDWLQRPLSAHAHKDQALSVRIAVQFEANRHVYGTRRLKACFAAEGAQGSRRRMGRLMAELDLQFARGAN